MPNYSLKLNIPTEALSVIKQAGQRIMLAKEVSSCNGPNVVWLSIDPFESTDVEWTENYGIYAATSEASHGATISRLSETPFPAIDGVSYTLSSHAIFESPEPDACVPRNSFGARNEMPYADYPSLVFGLSQSALVNKRPVERKPISATPVLSSQSVVMTPYQNVHIWLQANFESETIITRIEGRDSVARFGGEVNALSLTYDTTRGEFI